MAVRANSLGPFGADPIFVRRALPLLPGSSWGKLRCADRAKKPSRARGGRGAASDPETVRAGANGRTSEMKAWKIVGAVALAAGLGGVAFAQTGGPIKIANVGELSGGGATVGTNFNERRRARRRGDQRQGRHPRPQDRDHARTTRRPIPASRARQVQKALDERALRRPRAGLLRLGHGQHGAGAAAPRSPQITGGEAASITQQGNPYVFRTSFGQQIAMPKIAQLHRATLKAKTVAVIWVNNDFGKGGRDNFIKELDAARHQGRGRHLDRAGPGRFRRRRR